MRGEEGRSRSVLFLIRLFLRLPHLLCESKALPSSPQSIVSFCKYLYKLELTRVSSLISRPKTNQPKPSALLPVPFTSLLHSFLPFEQDTLPTASERRIAQLLSPLPSTQYNFYSSLDPYRQNDLHPPPFPLFPPFPRFSRFIPPSFHSLLLSTPQADTYLSSHLVFEAMVPRDHPAQPTTAEVRFHSLPSHFTALTRANFVFSIFRFLQVTIGASCEGEARKKLVLLSRLLLLLREGRLSRRWRASTLRLFRVTRFVSFLPFELTSRFFTRYFRPPMKLLLPLLMLLLLSRPTLTLRERLPLVTRLARLLTRLLLRTRLL